MVFGKSAKVAATYEVDGEAGGPLQYDAAGSGGEGELAKPQQTEYEKASAAGLTAESMRLHKRKCTDILFLVLFFVFWVGMFYVAGMGVTYGDPAKLINPTDYRGGTCGSLKDSCSADASDTSCSSKPFCKC